MAMGQRLKGLRDERGLTQERLAEELGISKSTIGMYETDKREPGFETLEAIADYFNVDMDYLLGKSNVKNMYQLLTQIGGTLAISDSDPQINELLGYANQLNAQGKERLCRYAEDLTRISDYRKKKSPMPVNADTEEIRVAARGGEIAPPPHAVDKAALEEALKDIKTTKSL